MVGGQCGLYVAGAEGVEFDDVGVHSAGAGPREAEVEPPAEPDREFADDPYMAAWGSAQSEWEYAPGGGGQRWHRGLFFRSVRVRVAGPEGSGPVPEGEVALLGDEATPDSGYRLRIEADRLALRRGGKEVAQCPRRPAALVAQVEDGRVAVSDGDKTLLRYSDPHPPASGRVGVRFSRGLPGAFVRWVRVSSPHTREYRFDAAPVDWEVESGEWVATTRWACVPHWSFFGGRGKPVATLWNKRRFGGDQWIETFIAPREGSSDRMHFTFPINLNVTFCADGSRLGSGYSLVYRSHDQTTVLYRRGQPVAETKALVLPNWRADQYFVYYRVTQTWQHLQILRRGGRIQAWVEVPSNGSGNLERRQLVDWTDPNPLPGDRLALWTWGENGMSIARVRVSANAVSPAVPGFLRAAGPADQGNPINGGSFRTEILRGPVTPAAVPVVSFDYQAGAGTVLALYAEAGGQRFRARFLGDVTNDGDTVPFGRVQTAPAAGGWNRALFPLQQALRAFWPAGALPRVDRLYVANLSSSPEHVGGLSANPRGALFRSRPATGALGGRGEGVKGRRGEGVRAGGGRPLFAVSGADGSDLPAGPIRIAACDPLLDPARCTVTVNGRRFRPGEPGVRWDAATPGFVVDLDRAGLALKDGEALRVAVGVLEAGGGRERPAFSRTWRVRHAADRTPPAAPVVRTASGPDRVDTFEENLGSWRRMGDEQGASLWRDDATAASGRHSLRLYHRKVAGSFGAVARDRPFDVRRWPILTFAYRLPPEVQLSLLCEIAGRWYEIAFTDSDHTFPVVGTIAGVRTDGKWHQAEVDLAAAIRRSGAESTTITRLFFGDTGMMNNLQDVAWHLDDFRLVPALPAGQANTLSWAASDASGVQGYSWILDSTPGTVPDETAEPPTAGVAVSARARFLHVRARDGAGNWGPAAHFQFAPLTEVAAAGPPAPRPAPGSALSAAVVEIPLTGSSVDVETVRWTARVGAATRTYALGDGCLELDARAGVLRWRDPELAPAMRDGGEKHPLNGTGRGSPAPTAAAGLRPGGAAAPGAPAGASLSPRNAGGDAALACTFSARDLAGRLVTARWEWRLNPAQDKTPPPAPFVSYIPQNRLCRHGFEEGFPNTVALRRSAWVLPDKGNAALGKGCARVVNLEANDFFAAFLHKEPFAVNRYPRLAFDYRFEGSECNLNLVSVVNGDMQIVGFAGQNGGYREFVRNTIGQIPDVRQDGQWHHAEVDLGALLRKRYPKAPRFFADYLGTWATGSHAAYDNPQGISLWLDNVTIYSPQAVAAAFEWQPPADAGGIRGYSYVLDQKPGTVPEAKVRTSATSCRFEELRPGRWVFHLRACDAAGNWGPPAHLPFDLTGSP